MATVVSRPQNTCSAYEPARYTVDSINTASLIEKMIVNVRTASGGGGTIIGTLYRDWIRRTGAGPAYVYRFEVDIAGILQTIVGSSAAARYRAFLAPGFANRDCVDAYQTFYMEFKFLFRDPATNLLADLGDTAYVDLDTKVFNVIRPNREIFDTFQNSLYRTTGAFPNNQKLYNFNTGAQIPIRYSDTYSLCFNTNGFWFVRIVELKANGTIHTSYLELPSTIYNFSNKVFSVQVGPNYLKSLPSTDFDANVPPQFDAATVSYKMGLTNAVRTLLTEELEFVVMPECGGGLRLAWVNQRGGVDMYTFDAKVVEGVEGASEIGIRPNVWASAALVPTPESRGSFKVSSERNEYYEIETRVLRPNLAEFVSQVLTSPEVYIYDTAMSTVNPYRSVIISDGQLIESDSDEIGMILKFKVYPANQTPTHVQ